nr:hypothetical protein [Tanacetum cinerariifolium]
MLEAQQQLFKKQNVVQAYAVGTGEKKPYEGSKPLCPKYNYHHDGDCAPKDAPTLSVSAEKNLGDPIEIRVDIVHHAPTNVFPAATVVRTLAQYEEAIRGIHGHLQGEKKARMKLERQLALVQESQRQDQENFRKLQDFVTRQLRHHS